MSAIRTDAFFLAGGNGLERFCLIREAPRGTPSHGAILYVHPFAEEMNKTRRAVAVAASRLAQSGWTVMQIDLLGCGDSAGDFADARWPTWQDDIRLAARWLSGRGTPVRMLWGLRLGALLAASVADRLDPQPDLLLWQPVLAGKAHLTQFLRLKAAEQMIGDGGERGVTARLRDELKRGASVSVGGYDVGPELAQALDSAELSVPDAYSGRIYWLETGRADSGEPNPASSQRIQALVSAGHTVTACAVAGSSFWQTVEIEECPTLVEATLEMLGARVPPAR